MLPLGYRYSSLFAGIRRVPQDDLGLIVSYSSAAASGVFTQNRVQAAPVRLARSHLTRQTARAILVNAGNANCATVTGDAVARQCCEAVAKRLGIEPEEVLPASTGVIGVELDASLITSKVDALVSTLSPDRFEDVARSIMTTDRSMKVAYAQAGPARIAGMTKGAGMIQPNMATTLGFILTDAALTPPEAARILSRAVAHSYNRISVDGDTSTNDTILLLANGAAGPADQGEVERAVGETMDSLAQQIARDGEGARKLITIEVTGAATEADAERIARAIANSPLVKTAVAGSDPNWGRILSAAGNSGVEFDPARVAIWMQEIPVCRNGVAAEFSEQELKRKLDGPDCLIRIVLTEGGSRARFWTCDLTEKYIEINASYRT